MEMGLGGKRERERERERQTDRDGQTDSQTDRESGRCALLSGTPLKNYAPL